MIKTTATALALLTTLSAAHASTVSVIDFENAGAHGATVTSVSSSDGVVSASVSATGGAGEARIFDTRLSGTADPDLEAPFLNDVDSSILGNPGNVLIVQEAAFQASDVADDNRSGGKITLEFFNVVDFLSFTILDDAEITITADTGAQATREVESDSEFRAFEFGDLFAGVSTLTFDFNGQSGAFDDLAFTTVAPVPVPAALPMLLAGLGGLAYLGRRRKNG